MSDSLTLQPVAVIHTPYKEKFSIPRQPNLVQDGTGIVELLSPYNQAETVRGLEQFSHLWLIFQFDQIPQGKWHPTVRAAINGLACLPRARHIAQILLVYPKWNCAT